MILPQKNEHDLEDIPEEVRKEMTFIFADDMATVLDTALVPVEETERDAALDPEPASGS